MVCIPPEPQQRLLSPHTPCWNAADERQGTAAHVCTQTQLSNQRSEAETPQGRGLGATRLTSGW